jgi:hypothetical protein
MRFNPRLAVALTALLAAAIAVPAETASAASSDARRPAVTTVVSPPPSIPTETQVEAELAKFDRELAGEAPTSAERRRVHCNWARCWWQQWIGLGYYLVGKYTWTGTWYVKRRMESANDVTDVMGLMCGYASPSCSVLTWATVRYFRAMANRAIRHRRCLVQVNKLIGVGPPLFLRTARCNR